MYTLFVEIFWKERFLRGLFFGTVLLFFLTGTFALVGFESADHLLIIHFIGGEGGAVSLGGWFDILSIFLIEACLLSINTLLAMVLYRRMRILADAFVLFNFVCAVLLLIAISAIISVN